MLEQHSDSTRPAIRASRKVGVLLIEDFAGMSVADSDQHVVVRLGDSSHHSEERLFGAGLRRNAGLTPVAVSQRLCLDRLGVDIAHVYQNEPSGPLQHPPRFAADL